jgi:diguanylate cyclase (GGDEF)-like protein/PAS domain S-box-containing protein
MFIVILSFLSVYVIYKLNHENDNLYNHPFIVTNAIKDIEIDIRHLSSLMPSLIDENQQDDYDENLFFIRELETNIHTQLLILEEKYLGDMEDVQELEDAYIISENNRQVVIDYIENSQFDLAQQYLLLHRNDISSVIFEKTNVVTTYAENKAVLFRLNAQNNTNVYMTVVISVSVILIISTLGGVYFLNKDIYPPIKDILRTIDGQGKDEDINDLPLNRNDEIGQVANAINDMLIYMKSTHEMRELELKLDKLKSQELLRITMMSIGEAVLATDLDGTITNINPAACQLLGVSKTSSLRKNIDEVLQLVDSITRIPFVKGQSTAVQLRVMYSPPNSISLLSRNGKEYYVSSSFSPIMDEDSKIYGVVITLLDISKEIKRQEEIKFLSEHDSLTKLENRFSLEYKILNLQERNVKNVGMIMGDVNGLKITNDAFGHAFGDKLLVDISNILVEATSGYISYVYRWGGDEFVVVLEQVTEEDLDSLCKDIKEKSKTSEKTGPVRTNISLGYALLGNSDQNLYRTLIRAEDMMYENKLLEKDSNRSQIVNSLETSLYEKSYETKEHALRVAKIAEMIGRRVNLSQIELTHVILLAKLHDIGKISIDDSILNKKEPLTDDEWKVIKKHSETGYRIASSLSELTHIAEGILNHHEHFDGSGYPRGIKGHEIPLMARIVSIADSYDVMISKRIYKSKMSKEGAMLELQRNKNKQFDPDLVDIFMEVLEDNELK